MLPTFLPITVLVGEEKKKHEIVEQFNNIFKIWNNKTSTKALFIISY